MTEKAGVSGQFAIPRSALLLGWAGVIPFAALALAVIFGWEGLAVPPRTALVGYGATILSFLGGAQWGLTTAGNGRARGGDGRRFGISVLPQLLAWPCLFMPPVMGLLVLSAGFILLVLYDIWTVRAGLGPAWYGSLRLQLTLAAILCLVAAAAA